MPVAECSTFCDASERESSGSFRPMKYPATAEPQMQANANSPTPVNISPPWKLLRGRQISARDGAIGRKGSYSRPREPC